MLWLWQVKKWQRNQIFHFYVALLHKLFYSFYKRWNHLKKPPKFFAKSKHGWVASFTETTMTKIIMPRQIVYSNGFSFYSIYHRVPNPITRMFKGKESKLWKQWLLCTISLRVATILKFHGANLIRNILEWKLANFIFSGIYISAISLRYCTRTIISRSWLQTATNHT